MYNNAEFVCSVYQNDVRNVSCKDSVLAIQNEKVIVLLLHDALAFTYKLCTFFVHSIAYITCGI